MPDTLQSLYSGAMQVAYTDPLLYRIAAQKEAADTSFANNIAYWQTVYPKVELRATDNPDIDFRLLTMPWSADYGNPPLVFLMVTPRKKELPKLSDFLTTAGMFAPIVAAIPVVGAVLSIALSVAAAADKQSRMKAFIQAAVSITNSEFEPQFYPNPFPVLLPLDQAQIAVDQPWLLPKMWDEFKHRIQEAQKVMAQMLTGAPSTLTLSPNLNPTVVAVTAPGQVSPGQSNEAWLDNLYAAFDQVTSKQAQFEQLQGSLGSRVPAAAPGTQSAPAAAQPAAQLAGSAGGILLALGAGAVVLLAHR